MSKFRWGRRFLRYPPFLMGEPFRAELNRLQPFSVLKKTARSQSDFNP